MARHVKINVSFTELAAFRRLVAFLEDVERYADDECDLTLKGLVDDARDDLLRLREET